MAFPLRQTCLLATVVGLPVLFPLFCLVLSRRRQGGLLSYAAYFFLFGCAGQWLLAVGLVPSEVTQTLRIGLLTAAPAVCLALAVALQRQLSRVPFDTGAMVSCYLYPALVVVGVALTWFSTGGIVTR